jgi:membrane protease YdiL (CAAX protease family)
VIQAGLRDTYGQRQAVIWTGFLFALLHLNPWNFLGLWSFGCLLGYITERTGSIRPAIVLHMLKNTKALLVFAVQGRSQWDERPEFIPWYWTLLAGAVLIFSIRELHRLTFVPELDSGMVSVPSLPGAADPFHRPPVT